MPDLQKELKTAVKLVIDHRGQRPLLVREYFFRLAKRFTPVVAVDAGDVRFLVSTSDDVMGRVTFMHRGFDEAAMRRVIEVVAEHTGRPEPLRDRTVLDVGGNIGTTSVYAVKRFGARRAIAFEPAPANLDLLRQNVTANGLQDAVDVHAMAISDSDGEVRFELSADDGGDHRVRTAATPSGTGSMGEHEREVIAVPARRLDAVLEEQGVDLADVAMLWIDVQGHEAHVLAGAPQLLAGDVPVCLEYWPHGLRRAGGLDQLHELIAASCTTVVDLGPPDSERPAVRLPASEVASLAERYQGEFGFADLVLLT